MFFPIVASLAKAGGIMVDKFLLSLRAITVSKFVVWLFIFLTIFTLPFLFIDSSISLEALSVRNISLFFLMVGLAGFWNILYYKSIQSETVQEFEPILMLSPLVVILITPLFFPDEVSRVVFYIAIVAGASLALSHLEKSHLKFSKDSLGLVLAIVVMSFETIVIRELLFFFSPAALYFFRCLFLVLVFLVVFKDKLLLANRFDYFGVGLSAILGVAQMLAIFYGYQNIGLVFTTLVISIAPVLVYLYCFIVLKEKFRLRKVIGGVVILACVILAYLLN
jgi:drug/metabolite transporter (DMT)-like permease